MDQMDTSSSPHYSDERLAACDAAGLIDLMLRDEDRVPRNVIDECARRPEVNQLLISMLQDDSSWIEAQNPANWWLKFHAIMILGLIPSADAGMALVEVIPRISDEGDLELDDLFSGCWPVLFRNKPDEVFAAVEIAAANRSFEPFVRRVMLEVLIDAARRNQDALNARLAWAARIAADKTEEWMMRVLVGSLLLLFPREDYRPVLETLAAKQRGQEALFSRRSVINAYAMMLDAPPWEDHSDPWGFYAPEAIQARQLIAEEDPLYATDDEIDDPAPFFSSGGGVPVVRAAPKIGRNEPCPCGSGKKFKKCCLASIPHHEQN